MAVEPPLGGTVLSRSLPAPATKLAASLSSCPNSVVLAPGVRGREDSRALLGVAPSLGAHCLGN